MEGGEDASEEPGYVTTTAESPADVLHIQVDMVDDDRGGMWCVLGDGGQEDVSTVATRLRRLDDIGNREDFHRQCCEVSCCTAKEVIRIMHSGPFKVSLVQIASEIFLLQNLLNPTHYSCTEELLDSWLSVQEDKDQGTSTILENVNKMLALVESVEHLVIFLRSLLKRFGTMFLGLCSDLALRALKQQRHLAAGEGSEIGDCPNRQKLSQTLDLVGQMFFETHRQLCLSCLLSALYVEPTDRRYFALEIGFTKPSDATAAAADVDGIQPSSDVLADLLHTVNMFRPAELDLELGWPKLKPVVTDLLFCAGYHYDPANNMFSGHSTGKVSGDLRAVVVDNNPWVRATQPDDNQASQATTDRSWCSVVNSSDFSSSSDFIDGKKPWSAGGMSAFSTALWPTEYCGVKVENVTSLAGRDLIQANGNSSDVMIEMPDSTSTDVAVSSSNKEIHSDGIKVEYLGSNGSLDSNGIDSRRGLEPWKGTGDWSAFDSDDEASNPLNIASAEEEDVSSIAEEVPVFESSSAFSKKRSASAEMMSSSQMAAEPSRKRRAVSISRSKSLRQSQSDKDAETVVDAAAECGLAKDVSLCKRTLRPKDLFERSRVVTRKTFCFRYKYSFASKTCVEETGKRSVSESDASKSKISVPNGVKLKNCFIRLNRVKTEAEQSQPEETNESVEGVHGSASLTHKEAQINGSTPLTLKEEQSTGCGSLTLKEEQSTASPSATLKEVPSSTALPLKETVKLEAEVVGQDEIVIKEEAAAAPEEKFVQCVCDGCGEIVPDCSWLTAHIVTCSGRPESGVTDAMMDDELTNTFQSETPIWDAMGGGDGTVSDSALDTIAPASDTNADGNGAMLSMETANEIVPFASQSPAEVDPSNLMQHLLQNRNNQSSFIYDPMTSEAATGVKVIQMSDGTSYSVATQQSAVSDMPEEQCGKEVLYNGVYMYEFTEYQCDMCLLSFASHSATADHIRSSDHSGSTISRNSFCCCLKCSIRYREKHIMWHHILYLCGNAGEEPADESRLYRCLLCCKAFLSAAFLRRHVCLQHGRQALSAAASHGHRPLVEASSDGIVRQLQSAPPGLREAPQVMSRLSDYGVGLDGQLLGTWNCFQVNEGGTGITAPTAQDNGALSVFSVPGQETAAEADLKTKSGERNGETGTSSSTTVNRESGADSQALLDLACSIVLGGCSPPSTNFTADGASVPANTSHPSAPAASASTAAAGAAANQSSSAATSSASSRRTAKGIMYKNVFMQCIVNYLCSTCKKDLSTKASKKEHRSSPCFDADSKRFTYLRQYSYLCPYCSEKFPSQKFCRQHQLSVCLQLMGVKTDELNHKQLLCPFCDRKYFNIITLKGHMTLIHKVNKLESNQILGTSGLLEELISFAPDAAGLSEKAKQAKLKTTAEEDRRRVEAKKPPPPPKETALKKAFVPAKGIFLTEKVAEVADSKADMVLENSDTKANKPKSSGGNLSSSQRPACELDVENGVSHDSGLESNVAEVTQMTELDGGTKNIDRSELHIVESADPDGLTFDGDTSNDMSTDDPSELDELSCETDNTLPTNDLKESQLDEADEVLDGKKSLKRKKSNKKTRRRVVTKTRKKLH